MAHADLDVSFLKRVRIGGYKMPHDLGFSKYVTLKPHEIRRVLDKGAQNNPTVA